ncbi:MAG: DUF1440 domain-containing protein, partial [Alphaproteobacteria bacterium]
MRAEAVGLRGGCGLPRWIAKPGCRDGRLVQHRPSADPERRSHAGSDTRRELGGQLVHYGLGTLLGIGYGIAAEFAPRVTTGMGTAFGTGTWAMLDEAAVPAAGLGDPPWKAAPATQAYSLA